MNQMEKENTPIKKRTLKIPIISSIEKIKATNKTFAVKLATRVTPNIFDRTSDFFDILKYFEVK